MKIVILTLLNTGLIALFLYLLRQRRLLSFHQGGRVWLTFLAVGVITLMDEFTSIFYAPAEDSAEPFSFSLDEDKPVPSHRGYTEGGGVRNGRPPDRCPFRLAHVFLAR